MRHSANWSSVGSHSLQSITSIFDELGEYREIPPKVLDLQEGPVLVDEDGRGLKIPCNLLVRQAGRSDLIASRRRFSLIRSNVLSDIEAMHDRLPEPWRNSWMGPQRSALEEIVNRFFGNRDREFGTFSLVYARRTKANRFRETNVILQAHKFLDTFFMGTCGGSPGQESELGTRVRFDLSRLHWKSFRDQRIVGGDMPRIVCVCHEIRLSHADFQHQLRAYHEHRWTMARCRKSSSGRTILSPQDDAALMNGVIPVLAEEENSELYRDHMSQTLLISLTRFELDIRYAENLTLELDPRTLELISIRQYYEETAVEIGVGGTFDQALLGASALEFAYSV
ncbi:hypothetical protein DTL42_16065 [Bremerella cremea]|uniref:Uncharacterized protein n=1 Tax=Bremerella cremea TaxID=1031537 RepID=A0A368KRP8_9BACT|nr:hypothetical protein [Bremerella cremea]RCS46471.1 hypothetical protein DTL42_16065 [Bremerella cremea]